MSNKNYTQKSIFITVMLMCKLSDLYSRKLWTEHTSDITALTGSAVYYKVILHALRVYCEDHCIYCYIHSHHPDYHVEFWSKMAVCCVEREDANIEDDNIYAVNCLGMHEVPRIYTKEEPHKGKH